MDYSGDDGIWGSDRSGESRGFALTTERYSECGWDCRGVVLESDSGGAVSDHWGLSDDYDDKRRFTAPYESSGYDESRNRERANFMRKWGTFALTGRWAFCADSLQCRFRLCADVREMKRYV